MLDATSKGKRRPPDKQQPCPFCHGSGIATPDPEEQLINAIAIYAGNRTFNTHELMAYAMVTGGPLRDAIGLMSSVQLGKSLRAIFTSGKNFDGIVLERQGVDNAGARWRVFFRK